MSDPSSEMSKYQHHKKAMPQMQHGTSFLLQFKFNLLVKSVSFLLNAAFAMALLALIFRAHLA